MAKPDKQKEGAAPEPPPRLAPISIGGHRYLTVKDVVSAFQMSERTVIAYLKDSGIPEYTMGPGRITRYREEDVANLIKRKR